MQQFASGTPRYNKQERLLQRMRTLRKQQKASNVKLAEKLTSLKTQLELTKDENYRIYLKSEISHIERILSNLPQMEKEER